MKRILILFLTVAMVSLSLIGCGTPPKYEEVEARLAELIEQSYGVNDILFGEGLPVYERVYEVWDEYYRNEETGKAYYYHTVNDGEKGEILAYRPVSGPFGEYTYLSVEKSERAGQSAVYHDAEKGLYYYPCEYEEKTYEFYYGKDDPTDYDFVTADSPFSSIEEIKAYAEKTYSKQYLESVYEMLFTGAALSEEESGVLGARFMLYEDSEGTVWLMQSNRYESLIQGKRIFDLSTAKVVRPGNKNFCNIEIESYLEGSPEDRTTVKISLAKQDGEWYLDSATY